MFKKITKNIIEKINKYKEKYGDIYKIYNIKKILDDHILLNDGNKIYIYKITPINIIFKSEEEDTKIISSYTEFLRKSKCSMQILVRNIKLNHNAYVNKIKEEFFRNNSIDNTDNRVYFEYFNELSKSLEKEAVCIKTTYLVIKKGGDDMLNDIKKLEDIGVKVKLLGSRSDIISLLYETFKKEGIN